MNDVEATIAEYERKARAHFDRAFRDNDQCEDATGRILMLNAERVRLGLQAIADLPQDIRRQWDLEGAHATLRDCANNPTH